MKGTSLGKGDNVQRERSDRKHGEFVEMQIVQHGTLCGNRDCGEMSLNWQIR